MNVLGSAIKFIAGNPDNEDLEIIHQSLEILKVQENKITQNQMRQIKINDLFQNQINNITEALRKIGTKIAKQYNTVQNLRSDLEFINLIFNVDRIIHILESIEEQIEFSRLGLVNKNILSLEEKQIIARKLREQSIELNYTDDIFQYSSASIGINGGQAAILVKIPILDEKTYDLLELYTLKVNETRIDTHIKLVAKHGNQVYPQTSRCDICEGNQAIEDDCIHKILTHQPPKCKLINTKQIIQIKEVLNGIILVDTTENTEVNDSCGDSRVIKEATIIEAGNCTVRIRNLTFSGKIDITHQDEYLIPIYSKPLQSINYTHDEEESFMLRIKNLEELSEIQLSLNHTQRRVTFGGAILLALTFFCFFIAYLYKSIRGKSNTVQVKVPELLTVTNTEVESKEAKSTETTTGKRPDFNQTRLIPEPRFELLKHQARTLDT